MDLKIHIYYFYVYAPLSLILFPMLPSKQIQKGSKTTRDGAYNGGHDDNDDGDTGVVFHVAYSNVMLRSSSSHFLLLGQADFVVSTSAAAIVTTQCGSNFVKYQFASLSFILCLRKFMKESFFCSNHSQGRCSKAFSLFSLYASLFIYSRFR